LLLAEEEKKNSFVAAVFSLVFAGLGFVYIGHYKRFAACLLGTFVALFLTLTAMQITGISPGTEFGRFVLFIVLFSFWAYLAFLTEKVCDGLQGKNPVKDTFSFWETKRPGQEKSEKAGEKPKREISPRGLLISAAIAAIFLFLLGPVAALFAFAVLIALAYFGSI